MLIYLKAMDQLFFIPHLILKVLTMSQFVSQFSIAPFCRPQNPSDSPLALENSTLEAISGGYKQREDGGGCTDILRLRSLR